MSRPRAEVRDDSDAALLQLTRNTGQERRAVDRSGGRGARSQEAEGLFNADRLAMRIGKAMKCLRYVR
jgi:hypothetical protein